MNRRIRIRTYGGVGGRNYLVVPPTRFFLNITISLLPLVLISALKGTATSKVTLFENELPRSKL